MELIIGFVQDLVQRKPGFVTSMWHSKVIAVIECITDQEVCCWLFGVVKMFLEIRVCRGSRAAAPTLGAGGATTPCPFPWGED